MAHRAWSARGVEACWLSAASRHGLPALRAVSSTSLTNAAWPLRRAAHMAIYSSIHHAQAQPHRNPHLVASSSAYNESPSGAPPVAYELRRLPSELLSFPSCASASAPRRHAIRHLPPALGSWALSRVSEVGRRRGHDREATRRRSWRTKTTSEHFRHGYQVLIHKSRRKRSQVTNPQPLHSAGWRSPSLSLLHRPSTVIASY